MSSFIFFVVFFCSLASSLAVLLSSLVIMTVFGLELLPTSISHLSTVIYRAPLLFYSSPSLSAALSIPLPSPLSLSPSRWLCSVFFQLFCPLRSSPHSIDQSLPLSVSTPPSNLLSCSFSYYCLLNSALY